MNNKHAACVVIGAFIGLMGYGTLVMKRKLDDLTEQNLAAEAAFGSALQLRQVEHTKLLKRQRETEAVREFLTAWEPAFENVNDADKADRVFDTRVKQGGLIALNKSSEPATLKKDSAIANAIRYSVVFEDDFKKSLEWLNAFESEVAASRVSSCIVSKGQRGDDIKMELSFEFPLLAPATPVIASAPKSTP